jgi:hypothetical protein
MFCAAAFSKRIIVFIAARFRCELASDDAEDASTEKLLTL